MKKNNNEYFGKFGGQFVPDELKPALKEVEEAFESAILDKSFVEEYLDLMKNYVGRPSPLYFAKH